MLSRSNALLVSSGIHEAVTCVLKVSPLHHEATDPSTTSESGSHPVKEPEEVRLVVLRQGGAV